MDRVRLGRGAPLQLRRRRAEHIPDLERDAARGAGRLRARILSGLSDRPCLVHRRVLRQPRLGRRERLGVPVLDPQVAPESGVVTALFVVIGYVAGSMPWGYWLVRAFKGVDIRTQGSGNIGGTNVWRVYGRWLGFPVVFLDTAKGFVPALLAVHFAGHGTAVLAGAAAMLGHYRPLFLGFAGGGKVVATAGGGLG